MSNVSREDLRHSLIYTLPPVISSAVPLVTLPLITAVLPPAEYGAWALAVAYAQFVTGIANFGLTISYERNFFQYRGTGREAALLYSVIAFVLGTFSLAGLMTLLAREPISAFLFHTDRYGALLVWAFWAQVASSLRTYFLIYFRSTGDARAFAWYSIDENLLNALFSVVLVVGMKIGPSGLAIGSLMGSGAVLLALVARFMRRLPPAWDATVLRETLRISYPLTPRIFFGAVGGNIDKYLISLLGSMGGVGIYSIAQRIARVIFTFTTALENVFVPQVYRHMFADPDNGGEVGRYLTPFAYLSAGVALVVILVSPEAVRILTRSGGFLSATPVVAVLGLHYGSLFFGKIPQLVYGKKTWLLSVTSVLTIGLNAAFGVALVPRLGAIGAALATLLSSVATMAVVLRAGQKAYAIHWEISRLARIYALPLLAAVIVIAVPASGAPWWAFAGARVLVFIFFGWLGFHTGVVSRGAVTHIYSYLARPLGFTPR